MNLTNKENWVMEVGPREVKTVFININAPERPFFSSKILMDLFAMLLILCDNYFNKVLDVIILLHTYYVIWPYISYDINYSII